MHGDCEVFLFSALANAPPVLVLAVKLSSRLACGAFDGGLMDCCGHAAFVFDSHRAANAEKEKETEKVMKIAAHVSIT